MTTSPADPVAIVGLAAIMPQAPTAETFWTNLKNGVYSITDVPPERWDPAVYYDPDHSAVDKTYSRIGGWVREFEWNPIAWRLPIPPKVAEQMDPGQRWAVSASRAALSDAGYPDWTIDGDRVAVIFGNAIGGEKHYQSSMRIRLPEMLARLEQSATLQGLAPDVQKRIVDETRALYQENVFDITEDTMPGELSNVMAGRVANLFNLRGPNFTTDAACASALAAMDNAVLGLREHRFDAAVCGGVDRNMGVDAFVKFCKIGALSATGTRPFDAGADGFVMGEGAAVFVLKRLEDAERDGDRIYATILGIAGSSDGKGKGITAPNPVGQQLAVRRAWEDAGEDMGTVSAIEAHGTSTRVGDAAELTSLSEVFGSAGLSPRSVALGSVKSNIGHLKAAAGAAGLFKTVRSLHERVLVPSLHFTDPNPGVDWDTSAFAVNTVLREWPEPPSGIRRAGVSAFGFGGTNYHVVVEEHIPGRHRPRPRVHASAAAVPQASLGTGSYGDAANSPDTPPATPIILDVRPSSAASVKAPLRGALVLGAADDPEMVSRLTAVRDAARAGEAPAPAAPDRSVGRAPLRVAVDFDSADELAGKLDKVIMGLQTGNPGVLKMMRQQGAFVGRGPAPRVAFLYTGQGSQYVNMLRGLAATEPVVRETFAAADRVMTPLLGRPLTDYIFVDPADEAAVAAASRRLMQTEITQPAVLATDLALTKLLAAYGIRPDTVMGHSLGEYGALVAAGALSFEASLEAVSARGREMAHLSVEDNGAMAAVFGPLETIQRMVDEADGYAVVANINSYSQAVVGGATDAVERLIERFSEAGLTASRIPVSHAFHTSIVAPASGPFGEALRRLDMRAPTLPIVANVTGEFYPANATTETMLDYARRQIASPVQFVKGLETLYASGVRVFVEVGPKKALHGFVEDVLASRHDDVITLFTNHPKVADEVGVNQALCGLWAAGVGFGDIPADSPARLTPSARPTGPTTLPEAEVSDETITELGRLFAGVLEEGMRLYRGDAETRGSAVVGAATGPSRGSATSPPAQSPGAAPAPGASRPGAG
ncbi:MAG: type I polyketide synthase, partial [Dermatophilaceae bacterium]